MKITVNQLRRIIRETIEKSLDEMPLAAISGTVSDDSVLYDDDPDQKQVDRFHRSSKYASDAASSFKLFGINVYILPVYSQRGAKLSRAGIVPEKKAMELLKSSELDVEKIQSELESGQAAVLLSYSKALTKNFLPTTWMVLHAMFDSVGGPLEKVTSNKVENYIVELIAKGKASNLTHDEVAKGLLSTFTMRSAREGMINVDVLSDWAAELCTQAARREVKMSEYVNPKMPAEKVKIINDLAVDLQDYVNSLDVRGKVESFLRGNIIQIDVGNLF